MTNDLPWLGPLPASLFRCRHATQQRPQLPHAVDRQRRLDPPRRHRLTEHVGRFHQDRPRAAVGQDDDQQQLAPEAFERPGRQRLTEQRVPRRRYHHRAGQPIPEQLQSFAIAVGAGKTVAVRAAAAGLDMASHHVVYVPNLAFGTRGLYVTIVSALGGHPRFHKAEVMAQAPPTRHAATGGTGLAWRRAVERAGPPPTRRSMESESATAQLVPTPSTVVRRDPPRRRRVSGPLLRPHPLRQ
ncbi:MAG: ATP-binding protein [Actinomycetota bacterium]|nr:ATP-binding protein [Actinomycetota bacterium]